MPTLRTTDRTDLFYRDWGTGAPVVFLAGWALSGDMWQYQMLAAAERGFRAVCYDRRGHGRSDDPGRGYDFDTLADDLAALLEHLDLANVTVISHSMGGGEVVRYLSRHGSARVARRRAGRVHHAASAAVRRQSGRHRSGAHRPASRQYEEGSSPVGRGKHRAVRRRGRAGVRRFGGQSGMDAAGRPTGVTPGGDGLLPSQSGSRLPG
ncbi:alpha/beta fold hydrolase [Fodinicola feengrottensis]|uniref:alpha/beta fold hydrolase n=1 Tax=Fodinicola feengrottensis TaxID=435914 RepID=UPI0036F322DB